MYIFQIPDAFLLLKCNLFSCRIMEDRDGGKLFKLSLLF